ncbi:MAG: thermonuclease family protein [Firmicutes bacterium]|nr:thermonuclease family protein [Bacillota bacterium]
MYTHLNKSKAYSLSIKIIALALMLIIPYSIASCQNAAKDGKSDLAMVTRVVDGDTIVVRLNGKDYKVRFIGINTPERGRPYYLEATEKTKELCLGKQVRLEKDVSEIDKYGRLLRYVYVGDTFVNAELVKQGYAQQFTLPPDVKYADLFRKLASEARERQVGLWSPSLTSPPAPSNADKSDKSDMATEINEIGARFVGNLNSKVYHRPSCPYAKKISSNNVINFATAEAAKNQGYRPCKTCNP